VLNDAASLEMLAQACHAVDRLDAIAEAIEQHGVLSRTGKLSDLARHELALRRFVVGTLARLGLTVEPLKDIGRPPGV
jgi:hypothetical protein